MEMGYPAFGSGRYATNAGWLIDGRLGPSGTDKRSKHGGTMHQAIEVAADMPVHDP
ncbi:hypothetical protein GCM10023116_44630 [Kistimonas scapharcae]|uniref:Uncharacterized protein n=1 Tax=Kistimonas scapharcae TaxID=1036133 RepID=A0ABP8V882_9GAMM